jgi:outer membrane protein assembly factor BamA
MIAYYRTRLTDLLSLIKQCFFPRVIFLKPSTALLLKVLACFHLCIVSAFTDTTTSIDSTVRSLKIRSITISGNKVTGENTFRLFLKSVGVDTGTDYDSSTISYAKQRLQVTNLFSKVTIIPLVKNDGVYLYVIVQEVFYLNLDDFGAGYEKRKHGGDSLWYQARFGITQNNFRGAMETFAIRASFWDSRGLSLSWNKPLLPSQYFFTVSAGVDHYPDFNEAQNRNIVRGRFSLGRRLTLHSRGSIGITPMFTWVESLDNTIINKFHEVYSFISGAIDFRNDSYDPVNGWYASGTFLQNALYAVNTRKYGQLTTDLFYYLPAFCARDRFALHLQGLVRTNDAGPFRKLYLGGNQSVRGFPSGWIGSQDTSITMNHYGMISVEYRFPLLKTPVIEFSPLTSRVSELKGLYYEIDGTLIADAGHLWHYLPQPFGIRQNGGGIGVGLRIKAPTLRLSGCADVVWPITKYILDPKSPYYNRTVIYSMPELHLYVSSF